MSVTRGMLTALNKKYWRKALLRLHNSKAAESLEDFWKVGGGLTQKYMYIEIHRKKKLLN